MIQLILKTGEMVFFEMSNFEKEVALVAAFPNAKRDTILNLKQRGFYQVSEIENMEHIPLEESRVKNPKDPMPIELELLLGLKDQERLKAKLFAGYVQKELGYLPVKHPMFNQILQSVINENAHALQVKMPMYVNLLVNSVKQDTPKGA